MKKSTLRSIIMIGTSLILAYVISKANEAASKEWQNYSIYFISALIAFGINWLAFIPAYLAQTEKFYDLTGSLTYLTVIITAAFLSDIGDNFRAILIVALVSIWTLRLGTFLYRRILKDGGRDGRFDQIKPNFLRFLTAWTLQALWVFLTLSAGLAVLTSTVNLSLGIYAYVGVAIWIIGFSIEVIADRQKTEFKAIKENKGKFISTGLWAYSRHPNYFGEIVLWIGIFIIAIPVLEGWQWATIISPIFVYCLLNYVSGVNLLEKIADERWGGQEDYETYKAQTSVLIPRTPKR